MITLDQLGPIFCFLQVTCWLDLSVWTLRSNVSLQRLTTPLLGRVTWPLPFHSRNYSTCDLNDPMFHSILSSAGKTRGSISERWPRSVPAFFPYIRIMPPGTLMDDDENIRRDHNTGTHKYIPTLITITNAALPCLLTWPSLPHHAPFTTTSVSVGFEPAEDGFARQLTNVKPWMGCRLIHQRWRRPSPSVQRHGHHHHPATCVGDVASPTWKTSTCVDRAATSHHCVPCVDDMATPQPYHLFKDVTG